MLPESVYADGLMEGNVGEHFISLYMLLVGAVVGSFLNVVIHRLPLGLSVVRPRSRCPKCESPIKAIHNVPVLSYLLLRGRCANCGVSISMRYPFVEALTGALWLGVWLRFGPTAECAANIVLVTLLVAITFIDIDHLIIPDSMSLGAIPVGLAFSLVTPVGWKASLLGTVAGGGVLILVAEGYRLLAKRDGMGYGDVKLLAGLGAFLGWKAIPFIILIGSVTGAVVGVTAMRLAKGDLKMEVPFGPFLALGALVYVFRGKELLAWYMGG